MTAEGVAVEGPKVKLSTELLPEEALERSKVGSKFEKIKCEKPGDVMFTEVSRTDNTESGERSPFEHSGVDEPAFGGDRVCQGVCWNGAVFRLSLLAHGVEFVGVFISQAHRCCARALLPGKTGQSLNVVPVGTWF